MFKLLKPCIFLIKHTGQLINISFIMVHTKEARIRYKMNKKETHPHSFLEYLIEQSNLSFQGHTHASRPHLPSNFTVVSLIISVSIRNLSAVFSLSLFLSSTHLFIFFFFFFFSSTHVFFTFSLSSLLTFLFAFHLHQTTISSAPRF